jgi:NAD(P)-dependent dehydrogenase (short-subunit alcohol dehydrogenase family)
MRSPVLKDKVVVVTGAGRGIGAEIATLCAAEGAAVVVNDLGANLAGRGRDESPARSVVERIRAAGGNAQAQFGDVSCAADADALVEAAVVAFGRVDAVVNNAGNMVLKSFEEMTLEDFDAVLKVHLYGAFNVSRAAAAHFIRQGSGAFLHMTSSASLIGNPGCAGYCAAKGGVAALSRAIALDLAAKGVRSNCIAPSAVSRMSSGVSEIRARGLVGVKPANDQPADKRQGQPAQVAPIAAYLVSDVAAGISGQIFGVRGNEIYLYSQSRPVRTLHRTDGWTPQQLALQLEPAWRTAMTPLETLQDVFAWPPQ